MIHLNQNIRYKLALDTSNIFNLPSKQKQVAIYMYVDVSLCSAYFSPKTQEFRFSLFWCMEDDVCNW